MTIESQEHQSTNDFAKYLSTLPLEEALIQGRHRIQSLGHDATQYASEISSIWAYFDDDKSEETAERISQWQWGIESLLGSEKLGQYLSQSQNEARKVRFRETIASRWNIEPEKILADTFPAKKPMSRRILAILAKITVLTTLNEARDLLTRQIRNRVNLAPGERPSGWKSQSSLTYLDVQAVSAILRQPASLVNSPTSPTFVNFDGEAMKAQITLKRKKSKQDDKSYHPPKKASRRHAGPSRSPELTPIKEESSLLSSPEIEIGRRAPPDLANRDDSLQFHLLSDPPTPAFSTTGSLSSPDPCAAGVSSSPASRLTNSPSFKIVIPSPRQQPSEEEALVASSSSLESDTGAHGKPGILVDSMSAGNRLAPSAKRRRLTSDNDQLRRLTKDDEITEDTDSGAEPLDASIDLASGDDCDTSAPEAASRIEAHELACFNDDQRLTTGAIVSVLGRHTVASPDVLLVDPNELSKWDLHSKWSNMSQATSQKPEPPSQRRRKKACQMRFILLPFHHLHIEHWSLFVARLEVHTWKLEHYDSCRSQSEKASTTVKAYLQWLLDDISLLSGTIVQMDCAQQIDKVNCGVLVIANAISVIRGLPPPAGSLDIARLRQQYRLLYTETSDTSQAAWAPATPSHQHSSPDQPDSYLRSSRMRTVFQHLDQCIFEAEGSSNAKIYVEALDQYTRSSDLALMQFRKTKSFLHAQGLCITVIEKQREGVIANITRHLSQSFASPSLPIFTADLDMLYNQSTTLLHSMRAFESRLHASVQHYQRLQQSTKLLLTSLLHRIRRFRYKAFVAKYKLREGEIQLRNQMAEAQKWFLLAQEEQRREFEGKLSRMKSNVDKWVV